MSIDNQITVLIPTSPIPSHSLCGNTTVIMDQTLAGIRHHLPQAKIIVMMDGVRPQIEFRRESYEWYKKELRQKAAQGQYGDIEFMEHTYYTQQARMTREALNKVTTPLIYFSEHDTPLVIDQNPRDGVQETLSEDLQIGWEEIFQILNSGQVNQVRFSFWETLVPEHEYLMRGQLDNHPKFLKTVQYSQWPNVATKGFYERILREHFHAHSIQMIEIPMYTAVVRAPWENFKVCLYYPRPNARRFYHLEGRIDRHSGQKDATDW